MISQFRYRFVLLFALGALLLLPNLSQGQYKEPISYASPTITMSQLSIGDTINFVDPRWRNAYLWNQIDTNLLANMVTKVRINFDGETFISDSVRFKISLKTLYLNEDSVASTFYDTLNLFYNPFI